MGAINNAFNQAAGAVAGAALAIEHAKETDFSKMNVTDNSALVARNQSRAADAEANDVYYETTKKGGLASQLGKAEANKAEAIKAYKKAVNRKNSSPKTTLKKFTELDAATRAADELRDKYQAVKDIWERAIEQKEYAIKATKLALDAKQKYQSRWGGKK